MSTPNSSTGMQLNITNVKMHEQARDGVKNSHERDHETVSTHFSHDDDSSFEPTDDATIDFLRKVKQENQALKQRMAGRRGTRQARNSQHEEHLDEVSARMQFLTKQLQDIQDQHNDEVTVAQQEVSKLEEALHKTQTQLRHLQEQNGKQGMSDEEADRLHFLEGEVTRLFEQCARVETEKSVLIIQREKDMKALEEDLEKKYKQEMLQHTQMMEELIFQQEKVDKLERKIKKDAKKIVEQEELLKTARTDGASTKSAELEAKEQELQEMHATLEHRVKEAWEHNSEVTQLYITQQEHIQELERKIKKDAMGFQDQKNSMEIIKARAENLSQQLQERQEEMKSMETVYEQRISESWEHNSQVTQLYIGQQSTIEDLENQIKQSKRLVSAEKRSMENLREEMSKIEAARDEQLKAKDDEMNELKANCDHRLTESWDHNAQVTQMFIDQQDIIKKLESKLDTTSTSLQIQKDMVERQGKRLREEKEKIESELSEKLEEKTKEMESMEETYQHQIADAWEHNNQVTRMFMGHQEKIQELEAQLKDGSRDLQAQKVSLENQLESLREECAEQEALLEAKDEELKLREEAGEKRVSEAWEHNADITRMFIAQQEKINEMEEQTKKGARQFESQKLLMKREVQNLLNECEKIKEERTARLQARSDEIDSLRELFDQRVSEAWEHNAEVTQKFMGQQDAINKLEEKSKEDAAALSSQKDLLEKEVRSLREIEAASRGFGFKSNNVKFLVLFGVLNYLITTLLMPAPQFTEAEALRMEMNALRNERSAMEAKSLENELALAETLQTLKAKKESAKLENQISMIESEREALTSSLESLKAEMESLRSAPSGVSTEEMEELVRELVLSTKQEEKKEGALKKFANAIGDKVRRFNEASVDVLEEL